MKEAQGEINEAPLIQDEVSIGQLRAAEKLVLLLLNGNNLNVKNQDGDS